MVLRLGVWGLGFGANKGEFVIKYAINPPIARPKVTAESDRKENPSSSKSVKITSAAIFIPTQSTCDKLQAPTWYQIRTQPSRQTNRKKIRIVSILFFITVPIGVLRILET